MNGPVASLGMYDHPAQRRANDALWSAIAERLRWRGIAAPAALDRSRPVDAIWRDPALLLAQCCGYPLVAAPDLSLRVVARPYYDVPGCAGGRHFSRIIVRNDDTATTLHELVVHRLAINDPWSNTGVNLLRAAVSAIAPPDGFFAGSIVTGSHRASIDAVSAGRADIAAIDAVTWAILDRDDPATLAGVRTLAITPSSPTLPFVTARDTPLATVCALREVLGEVIDDPMLATARASLLMSHIVPTSVHRYRALRDPSRTPPLQPYAQARSEEE